MHKHEPLGSPEADEPDPIESCPDPAGEALDQVWQREWERNLLAAAFRRVRAKVTARQLLIFRAASFGGLSIAQVAKKLDVSVAKVYLARHRIGKLFKSEVRRLQKETE